ncbi:hypothetical protein ACIBCN_19800 [Nocardia sp. NPDC051052]|uniref:hypothetical protein n=1 Tax=Nocardia sp. NPDC051052 TaxID=3364322 RepID=UPI0037AE5AB7
MAGRSANSYDYTNADPINRLDLTGERPACAAVAPLAPEPIGVGPVEWAALGITVLAIGGVLYAIDNSSGRPTDRSKDPNDAVAQSAAVGIPNLDGKSLAEAEKATENSGFAKWGRETPGEYIRYDNGDGSKIFIRPDGEIECLAAKVDAGPNSKDWHPHIGPDTGKWTNEHNTGERVVRPNDNE